MVSLRLDQVELPGLLEVHVYSLGETLITDQMVWRILIPFLKRGEKKDISRVGESVRESKIEWQGGVESHQEARRLPGVQV